MSHSFYAFDRTDEHFVTVNWYRNRISETYITTFRKRLTIWYDTSKIQVRIEIVSFNYYGYCNNDKYNILPNYNMRLQITQLLKNKSITHKKN